MEQRNIAQGFSTGSAAAAAAAAALRFLRGRPCSTVRIKAGVGNDIDIPITGCLLTERGADAWVTKLAMDESDVDHGAAIVSSVVLVDTPGISVYGGKGIGIVTKSEVNVNIPVGRAAIGRGSVALIRRILEAELPEGQGAEVTIMIPEGEELAKRTYNPRLGIIGGLSILDNSESELYTSPTQLDPIRGTLSAIRDAGARRICIVPGNYGRRMAMLIGLPEGMTVNVGNFATESLAIISNLGFEKIVIVAQIGKYARLPSVDNESHNPGSHGHVEALAAYAALHGASSDEVRHILDSTMIDEVAIRIKRERWGESALKELVLRIVNTVRKITPGIFDCAGLTFSLPDRELARTENLDRLIDEISEEAEKFGLNEAK